MTIKDGDIFRWRYKDEKPEHRREWGRYHCKSQIAVAKSGILRDTYWGDSSSGTIWSYDEAERLLELTFVANFADLEKRDEYRADYYDDADCVSLNHPNSTRGNFYVRKGAQRSRERMRVVVAERIAATEHEIAYRQGVAERLRELAIQIETATDLGKVYL